jgi:hypothetical protein
MLTTLWKRQPRTRLSLSPAFVPGKVGQAFSFDGQSRYVQASDDPRLDPTEEATIDAWSYFNQLPSSSTQQLMVIADKSAFNQDFLLAAGWDKHFHFAIGRQIAFPAGQTTITINVKPLLSPDSAGKSRSRASSIEERLHFRQSRRRVGVRLRFK